MIKKDKDEFLANWYLNTGELEKASELILATPKLTGLLRQVALAYSDHEDVEATMRHFELAVDHGDLKSLPWLIELLENFNPGDPRIPTLKADLDARVARKEFDVIFSLGNIALTRQEHSQTVRLWAEYLGTNNSDIDLNLMGQLMEFPEDEHLLKALGYSGQVSVESVAQFLTKRYLDLIDIEPDALAGFLYFCQKFEGYLDTQHINEGFLLTKALHFAEAGDALWTFTGLSMAQSIADPLETRFSELVVQNGLSDISHLVNADFVEQPPARALDTSNLVNQENHGKRIREIYDLAQEAQKANENERAMDFWIEGATLGDSNSFYNFSIALGNELGITANFFGAMGAEGQVWGNLSKSIQMNDMKPFEEEIHFLEEPLTQNVIRPFRQRLGLKDAGNSSLIPKATPASLQRICDVLDFELYQYLKIAENVMTLPYLHEGTVFQVLLELVEDDGKEFLLVHSPVLIGEGELTPMEKNILKMTTREAYLRMPHSNFLTLHAFNNIPKALHPTFFVNNERVSEIWSVIGPRPEEMVIELIPLEKEQNRFSCGIAIDLQLQSDHLHTAIQESVRQVAYVSQNMLDLQKESHELFGKCFTHSPLSEEVRDALVVSEAEQIKAGVIVRALERAQQKAGDDEDLSALEELAKNGVPLASRLALTVPDNASYIKDVAKLVLTLAPTYQEDVILREGLNALGWNLRHLGEEPLAVECFLASAKLGSGNALSTITWGWLLEGKYQEAVDFYKSVNYLVMTTRNNPSDFTQAPNARSNNALNLWALGADPNHLRSIWSDEYLQGDHVESKFYPILIDYELGLEREALDALRALNRQQYEELIETFTENETNQLWFGDLCRRSLALLKQVN